MGDSARVLRNLLNEVSIWLGGLPGALKDIALHVILPLGIIFVALGGLLRLFSIASRILFPPNSAALHKEALGSLKRGDDQDARTLAKEQLEASLKKDPKYLPAYLTLAAVYVYQEDDGAAGLKVAQEGLKHYPKDKDLLQLELDAKAVLQNMGHMVNAGFLSSKFLGDYSHRPLLS